MFEAKSWTALLGLALPGIGLAAEGVTVLHSEPLFAYRVAERSDAAKPLAPATSTVSFNAFGRDFTLELEPNARLGMLEAELTLPAGVGAYRGTLAGRPGSWARIVLTPDGPAGIVYDGSEIYGLETRADTAAATNDSAVIFRFADVYVTPGTLSCGTSEPEDGAQALAALVGEFAPLAVLGASFNLNIGAVADFEFSQAFGAAAETALLTRLNNVDGIFSEQVGVQITVAETAVFTSSGDPFEATAANTLLTELASYRSATPAQRSRGLTHMFTGRNLDGDTAGIAYLGALCSARFGSGLSEARRGAVIDTLVAAHEIGHNFGAPHDAQAGTACQSTPDTFLMAPRVNGSDRFSSCSLEQMQIEIAAAACLTPIDPVNLAVTTTPTARDALASIAFDHVFTVTNLGSDAAANANVAVVVDTGLELSSASSSSGACTVAGQTATCSLGAIGGGAARTVALSLRGAQVGRYDVTASATADAELNTTNNQATTTVTVAPLVDLVISGTPPASIEPNAQTTVTATLDNAGDFAATNVRLAAMLSAGLRPDQASIGGAVCAVAEQTVTCPAQTLAAHGSVALTLTLTGVTAGGQQVTLTATAAETDRSAPNNQLSLAVTVAAPASAGDGGGGGGGGGALAWIWVALLAAARWPRRKPA